MQIMSYIFCPGDSKKKLEDGKRRIEADEELKILVIEDLRVDYEEEIKYYQEEQEKFERDIQRFSERIFFNKICVVDDKRYFFPRFETFLRNYMDDDEDFRNSHITYTSTDVTLSDGYSISAYWQKNEEGKCNKVNCHFAKSLSEFIKNISAIKPVENHKCVYRGHGKWIYDLVPGIYREQNKELLKKEARSLKEFISSNPRFFSDCKSALDYLAVLQHYGFPTRLLDFTENPLVALYMACCGDFEEHGDVIRIDLQEESYKYFDSDTVAILSNIAFFDDEIDVTDFNYDKYRDLFDISYDYSYNRYGKCLDESAREGMVREFNERKDIRKLACRICNEKPDFINEIDPQNLENTIVLVKPKHHFERLALQSGLFALFGIDRNKERRVDFESQNLRFRITHIIIPAECKLQILKELNDVGINQGTLFGDMDHIVKQYLQSI